MINKTWPPGYDVFFNEEGDLGEPGWVFQTEDGNFMDGPYFDEAEAVDGAWKHYRKTK